MKTLKLGAYSSTLLMSVLAGPMAGADDVPVDFVLPELSVRSSLTATVEPASTFAAPVTRLELNPQIDLQVRNLAEAQGDVSIRGGIFENTGFRVGAATVLDPQTGHYFAELPIGPEMLQGPGLLVGAENALYGFNSTVGTVDFGWTRLSEGGSASLAFGDKSLNYQRLRMAQFVDAAATWGVEVEASRSESAGTILNGDHNFSRYSARVQRAVEGAQTDLFVGYQSKYLAWPELYAAPFGSNESDSVRTTFVVANHAQSYEEGSEWEVTAYHRIHHDHYLFNRAAVDNRSFVHETKASAAALAGTHRFSDRYALSFSGQFTADEIESTRLENNFTSRSYLKLAVLPELTLQSSEASKLALRAGLAFDDSNRDDSELSGLADLTWTKRSGELDQSLYLSFSEASQLAGYTAIGGATGGLFASNPNLERETSRNFELGGSWSHRAWSLKAALFHRQDDDLVDWTYSQQSSSARAANNVDIDTNGFEIIASKRFASLEVLGSYTFLDKDEDYGSSFIDASFYALNYAEHRFTAAAIWSPQANLEIRMDNEYRQQRENALRAEGGDSALFTHLGVSYILPQFEDLELRVAVENLWKDDFQEVPGTPGRGRQTSFGAVYRW